MLLNNKGQQKSCKSNTRKQENAERMQYFIDIRVKVFTDTNS
jgi:hypothetical protein